MLNSDEKELVGFVQQYAELLPVERRIRVYRGLADSLDEKSIRDNFSARARIMDEAQRRCAELNLNFPTNPWQPLLPI